MKDIKKEFTNNSKIVPVILAGGIGSRLWPLSRASYPKQFLKLDEANNFSMLQNTYLRINGIKHLDAPIIICNEEHRFIVAEQMREIEIKPKSIILEPVSRNTAPAIALASLKILEEEEEEKNDSILLILSADHLIKDTKSFKKAIQIGLKFILFEEYKSLKSFPSQKLINENASIRTNNFQTLINNFIS